MSRSGFGTPFAKFCVLRGNLRSSILCLAFAVAARVFAATPVAVWEGDFPEQSGVTASGITITYHDDNEVIENYDGKKCIRIGNGSGQGVTFSTNGLAAITAIFKYEAIPAIGTNVTVAAFSANNTANRTAVLRSAAGYAGTIANGSAASITSTSFATDYAGALAVGYGSGSTFCYTKEGATLCDATCGWPADSTSKLISAVTIGGGASAVTGYTDAMVGLRITAVAIFAEKLDASDVTGYTFPSEVNDTVYVLSANSKNWTASSVWKVNGSYTKWVSGENSVAKIPTAGTLSRVTVNKDVVAKRVVVTGSSEFTLAGTKTLTAIVDLSNYTSAKRFTISSPTIAGKILVGPKAMVGYMISSGSSVAKAYDFVGEGEFWKTGTGTLTYNKSVSVLPSLKTHIYGGQLSFVGVLPLADTSVDGEDNILLIDTQEEDFECNVLISGKGKFTKSGTGTLTMSRLNSYRGGNTIEGGCVKFNSSSTEYDSDRYGVGPIGAWNRDYAQFLVNRTTINGGATVDVNGYAGMPYVFIMNAGATLKNGSSVSIDKSATQAKYLELNGNATVDANGDFGLRNVGEQWETKLILNTYTLSKVGIGAFEVVNCSVTGTGTIDISEGSWWVYKKPSTASTATFRVREKGKLEIDADLTAGTVIAENGKIEGDGILTVNTKLDVSSADTVLRNLVMASGATLAGTHLTVKDSLEFGSSLNVQLDELPTVVKIATIPEATDISVVKTFTVNGQSGYTLYKEDTDLKVKKTGIVTGKIIFDSSEIIGGTDFTNATVSGQVKYINGVTASSKAVLNFDLTASDGTSKHFAFDYTGEDKFSCVLTGLTPGEFYAVDAYMTKSGLTADEIQVTVAEYPRAKMGDTDDAWIRESTATYSGEAVGTGIWTADAMVAMSNDAVAVKSSDMYHGLYFTPTNALTSHAGCEYSATVIFDEASEEIESEIVARFGATVWKNSAGKHLLTLVSTAEGWKYTSREVELHRAYTLTFVANEEKGVVNCFIREPNGKDEYVGEIAFEGSEVASKVSFLGAGGVSALRGDGYDTRLVTVDVNFDSTPGTNFAAVASVGTVTVNMRHATTHKSGTIRVHIRDSVGNELKTEEFTFSSLGSATAVDIAVDGLVQGEMYSVDVEVLLDGEEAREENNTSDDAPMAKTVAWIDEDSRTFESKRSGTGDWVDEAGLASAADFGTNGERRIVFSGTTWEYRTDFKPQYNDTSVLGSTQRVFLIKAAFDRPGFFLCDDPPVPEDDVVASVTLAADEKLSCSLALWIDGAWTVVPRSTFRTDLGSKCELAVRLNYGSGRVTYFAVSGGERMVLGDGTFASNRRDTLAFSGMGSVESIEGYCEDPNLMRVGTSEYWSFAEAYAAAGSASNIEPLWYSTYEFTDKSGAFRLLDPNGYFTPIFATWYKYACVTQGKLRIYRYMASNNWIDYADVSGVEATAGGWTVKTPEGLAYLAAESTNKWLSGSIVLAADLDLSECNWTPIARFTGSFDGAGHAIFGLNNTNVIDDAELGIHWAYPDGPTNEWGHSAYGIFATTKSVTMKDVDFDEVAISNTADSVATLVGIHEGGDIAVSGVTVASGAVRGEGGRVAGIVGSLENWQTATISGNANGASVEAAAYLYGDPRWAAGIATVGGTNKTGVVGKLTVTGNENAGTVANAVYGNEDGGNVAQIVAGTKWDSRFGEVDLTGNTANGAVDSMVVGGDAWLNQTFPICNLAAAVTRYTDDEGFGYFVEANEADSVPVDPVNRTARMLYGRFQNGSRNLAGEITDMVTAKAAGETLTIPWAKSMYDTWASVRVDRNLTVDLNGSELWTVGDCHTFVITNGAAVTVKNGKITYAKGYKAYEYTSPASVVDSATTVENEDDFYGRTVPVGDFGVTGKKVAITIAYTSPDFYYCVDETETLADDWKFTGSYEQGNGGTLTIVVPVDADSAFFRVRLSDYVE